MRNIMFVTEFVSNSPRDMCERLWFVNPLVSNGTLIIAANL
jgi:hypothetical protein